MSEKLTTSGESRSGNSLEVINALIEKYELATINSMVLQKVLRDSAHSNRKIQIETRSQIVDLGGFFIDETNSDPRYRRGLFVSSSSSHGDAVIGHVTNLFARRTEEGIVTQIEFNVDTYDQQLPARCYFALERTLQGCVLTEK